MIRNRQDWIEWENQYHRERAVDFRQNLRIYEALYEHACLLGALPPEDPLDGIEEKIRFAKAINVSGNSASDHA